MAYSRSPSELNTLTKLLASTSLKAYYRFNAGALTTDEKATYTLTNNNTVEEGTGMFGVGANFGLSNTNKSFTSTNSGLNNLFGSGGSISFWIYPTSASGNIINKHRVDYGVYGYFIYLVPGAAGMAKLKLDTELYSGASGIWTSTSDCIVLNQWNHVVVCYNGNSAANQPTFYVNGVSVALTQNNVPNGTYNTDTGTFHVGNNSNNSGGYNGFIDDLSLWTKILDRDEVKLLSGYTTSAQEFNKTAYFYPPQPREINSTYVKNLSTLKGYWRFESGALTTDSSGQSHTLTPLSDPAEGTGKFGGGVDLDGNDAYTIVDHADLKPTTSFAVGGWFKTSNTGASKCIFQSFNTSTVRHGIQLWILNTNVLQFEIARGTGSAIDTDYKRAVGTTNVCDNNWHFVVATWNGTTMSVFLDGRQEASVSWSNAPGYYSTNLPCVGAEQWQTTTDGYFVGSLDDVFLLNGTSLSMQDVQNLYAHTALYMKFDETSGTSVVDSSGNSNNGTASAASIIADNVGGIINNKSVFVAANSDKITITDHITLKPTGAFSIGFWIKTTTNGNQLIFQSYSRNSNYAGLRIDTNAGTGKITIESGRNSGTVYQTDYNQLLSNSAINDGNWHHVVFTWSGSYLTVYVDGKFDGNLAWSYAPGYAATNYVRIGCFNASGTDLAFFDGSLDDFFLLNGTALNVEQVRELYEGRKLGEIYPSVLPGLTGLFHFNNNAIDYAGGVGNGSLSNVTYVDGKFGKCVRFSGNGKITCATSPSHTFTWMFWLKTTTNANMMIISSDSSNCPAVFLGGTTMALRRLNVADLGTFTDAAILDGNWHHYAVSFNHVTGLCEWYMDGRLKSTNTYVISFAMTTLIFGVYGGGSNIQYLTGDLDEVAIYANVNLTAAQIKKYYMKAIGRL